MAERDVWVLGVAMTKFGRYPDLDLIVYHSGFDVGPAEGAYDEGHDYGVDRLITSLRKAAWLAPRL